MSLQTPLTAAVYLNTPFTQARQSGRFGATGCWSALVTFVFLGVPLAAVPFGRSLYLTYRYPHLSGFGWMDVWVGVAVGAAVGLAFLAVHRTVPIVKRLETMASKPRAIRSELSVSSTGDEIDLLFSLSLFAQRLLPLLFKIGFAIILVGVLGVMAAAFRYGVADQLPVTWFTVTSVYLVVLSGVALCLIAAMGLGINVISYGLTHGLVALDADVVGTPARSGHTEIFTLPWPTEWQGTLHSGIYNDPQVVAKVASWLKERVGPESLAPRETGTLRGDDGVDDSAH